MDRWQLGQKHPYLSDGPGDSGAVDTEQHDEGRVLQTVSQMDQRGDQPVGEDKLVLGASSCRNLPGPAACLVAAAFDTGLPRAGQLLNQTGECCREMPVNNR